MFHANRSRTCERTTPWVQGMIYTTNWYKQILPVRFWYLLFQVLHIDFQPKKNLKFKKKIESFVFQNGLSSIMFHYYNRRFLSFPFQKDILRNNVPSMPKKKKKKKNIETAVSSGVNQQCHLDTRNNRKLLNCAFQKYILCFVSAHSCIY